MRTFNTSLNFGMELVNLNKIVEEQEVMIDRLALKAAYYKASFYGKYELARKLINQIEENYDYCVGEFDGFCYSSKRANAVYRTAETMYKEGLLTKEEYGFCDVG